jgi:hypothetical protein
VSLVSGLFFHNFYILAKWPSLPLPKKNMPPQNPPLSPFKLKKAKLVQNQKIQTHNLEVQVQHPIKRGDHPYGVMANNIWVEFTQTLT